MYETQFADRADGGRRLALKLLRFIGEDCVVFGVARGGVVVAREVATHLDLPLDVLIVRKLGSPGNPEFACGAITAAGDLAIGERVGGITDTWLEEETKREMLEATRRETVYLQDRTPVPVEGRIAIVVDDGIATGLTTEAAILAVRRLKPSRVVVATPVATPIAVRRLEQLADEIIVVETTERLHAVGQAYVDFTQVKDSDVVACLSASPHFRPKPTHA